jgi:hypothetical protein
MKIKCGKYLADWRDSHGIRHRKAFASKKAAEKYQLKMRAEREENLRPSGARRPLPRPFVRSDATGNRCRVLVKIGRLVPLEDGACWFPVPVRPVRISDVGLWTPGGHHVA